MKILLISENRHKAPLLPYPLGVAYLAGNIDKKKHRVEVLDLMFKEDFQQCVETTVKDFNPEIIGLSVRNLDPNGISILPDVIEIIRICRIAEMTKREGFISNDLNLYDLYNPVKYIDNRVQGWISDRISRAAQEREGFIY
ncbi:hypothetical protein KJ966_11420 [bacterium]|nr:hypothetical protein [bacterium]